MENKIPKIINRVSEFRQNNPDDFDTLLEMLKELLDTYEKEPKLITQKLENLLS